MPKSNALIVELLTYEISDGSRQPRQAQVLIWLLAVGLLEWSIGLWLGGFVVFLWDVTKMRQKGQLPSDVMASELNSDCLGMLTLAVQIASPSAVALLMSLLFYLFSLTHIWQRVWKSKATIST